MFSNIFPVPVKFLDLSEMLLAPFKRTKIFIYKGIGIFNIIQHRIPEKEISQSMALKFMTFSPLFKPFVIHRGRSTALYAYAVNSKSSRCLLGAGLLLKLGII